jgi:hypothetical protein
MGQLTQFGRRLALLCLPAVLMVGLAARPASAITISFESFGCNSTPSSLGPFSFSPEWTTVCSSEYNDPGAGNNHVPFPSGNVAGANLYSEDGGVPTITSPFRFAFVGAKVTYFTQNDEYDPSSSAISLTIEGLLNGVSVGTIYTSFVGLDNQFYNVVGSLTNIDTLKFYSSNLVGETGSQDFWLIDDITLVPEPAALLLFGTGLALLAMRMRARGKGEQRTHESAAV